jgi:hypothetical protein
MGSKCMVQVQLRANSALLRLKRSAKPNRGATLRCENPHGSRCLRRTGGDLGPRARCPCRLVEEAWRDAGGHARRTETATEMGRQKSVWGPRNSGEEVKPGNNVPSAAKEPASRDGEDSKTESRDFKGLARKRCPVPLAKRRPGRGMGGHGRQNGDVARGEPGDIDRAAPEFGKHSAFNIRHSAFGE